MIPTATTVTEQGYWRKRHAGQWEALHHALILYRTTVITTAAFPTPEEVTIMLKRTWVELFQNFAQFPILYGMSEMVR